VAAGALAGLYARKEPRYFRWARDEIEPLLPAFSARVLEVGCGGGRTLEYLKQTRRAGWTCGIELVDEVAGEAAARVDQVIAGDVEQLDIPIAPGSLDLILLLDVLEHLVDPWRVMTRLTGLLRPGGHVIASLPNVRHHSVVLPLVMRGRWSYAPSGVLDRAHLRFFTRQSAVALVETAGLKVDAQRTTGVPRSVAALDRVALGRLRVFFELQYLLRARLA
jgi:SAM-dependent methyltransferase